MNAPDWSMRAPELPHAEEQPTWLSRESLMQLRRLAIGFIRWVDEALGLPQTIPDKETRRRERR